MSAEIPNGAVLVARAVLNSSLWTMRAEDRVLAMTCICMANWKHKSWWDGRREVPIRRGEFVTSLDKLSIASHLSKQNVRTSLQNLENAGFLTRKSTRHWTILYLPNYFRYQDLTMYSDSNGLKANTRANTRLTHAQHTGNTRLTLTKERYKKDKQDKQGKQALNEKSKPISAMNERGVEPSKASGSALVAPVELNELPLYAGDKALTHQFYELLKAWTVAFPGVSIMEEVRKAHAWEVANPKKRKVDRPRFLNGWMARVQDRKGGRNGTSETATDRKPKVDKRY